MNSPRWKQSARRSFLLSLDCEQGDLLRRYLSGRDNQREKDNEQDAHSQRYQEEVERRTRVRDRGDGGFGLTSRAAHHMGRRSTALLGECLPAFCTKQQVGAISTTAVDT